MTTPSGVLFQNLRVKPLSTTGTQQAGCYAYFYLTGTTTQTDVYADGDLTTPLSQPVTADSAGQFIAIYMDPSVTYRVQLYTSGGSLLSDTDPYVTSGILGLTGPRVGELLYPRTAAEIAGGVTPSNYQYPPGDICRYGAVSGSGDCTTAIQNAIAGNVQAYVPPGDWRLDVQITLSDSGVGVHLDAGAVITRYSAYSSATSPLFWYQGSNATIRGRAPAQ